MPLTKYIKQPLSPSLGQYTDAELRKIEASIFNIVENVEESNTAVQAAIAALQAQTYTESVVKAADESITSDTSLNVDSHLVLPIPSTGVWDFECMINAFFGNTGFAIQSVFFFTGTLSPAPPAGGHFIEHRANAENLYDSTLAVTTVSTDVILVNQQRSLLFRGLMTVATVGSLQFRWAQASGGSATPLTVRAGSFIRARKVA